MTQWVEVSSCSITVLFESTIVNIINVAFFLVSLCNNFAVSANLGMDLCSRYTRQWMFWYDSSGSALFSIILWTRYVTLLWKKLHFSEWASGYISSKFANIERELCSLCWTSDYYQVFHGTEMLFLLWVPQMPCSSFFENYLGSFLVQAGVL